MPRTLDWVAGYSVGGITVVYTTPAGKNPYDAATPVFHVNPNRRITIGYGTAINPSNDAANVSIGKNITTGGITILYSTADKLSYNCTYIIRTVNIHIYNANVLHRTTDYIAEKPT
jgi:hypothetical protein